MSEFVGEVGGDNTQDNMDAGWGELAAMPDFGDEKSAEHEEVVQIEIQNLSPEDNLEQAAEAEERFRATGIEMPENFDRANRVYMPKVTGEMAPGTAEIEFVGVRDAYRSQGVGKKMIQTLMDNPEYKELHLDVLDSHPWASKSYGELGFQPEGEKFGNYPDGTEGVQHMVLRKETEAEQSEA